jgi:hypothetical protein
MNDATCRDPFTPVNEVLVAVRARFDLLNLPASFAALRLHALAEASAFNKNSASHVPTFFGLHLAHHVDGTNPAAAQRRKNLRRMVDHLEAATVLCIRACAAIPKPLRLILEDAAEHCRSFDALLNDEGGRQERRHTACVQGGKARQARLDPARRRAARLILACAPPTGWRSQWHAARTIKPRLVTFIRARRINLTIEDSLERSIVTWIRNLDFVRAAYEAGCPHG